MRCGQRSPNVGAPKRIIVVDDVSIDRTLRLPGWLKVPGCLNRTARA